MPPSRFKSETMVSQLITWMFDAIQMYAAKRFANTWWGVWTPKTYPNNWFLKQQLAEAHHCSVDVKIDPNSKYSWDRMRTGNGVSDVIWGAAQNFKQLPSACFPSEKIGPRDHSPNTCHQCGKRQKWPCPSCALRGRRKKTFTKQPHGYKAKWWPSGSLFVSLTM